MSEIRLNLARKWRSRNFDQIIGQDLSVRMLKNSLYRGQFFPVYLFSGLRGCGKTTTARVFATALNCEKLSGFQTDPRSHIVPCLECNSCTAMLNGTHPDFIEIDAASHTGVDNVRNIIEASSLMPLMGGKKVYLIDEAHMLSKAAFNAFLKILEEPPESVLFILATTDPDKIIETVRSRCFQLFFRSIESDTLLKHLHNVCLKEGIRADKPGLELIIKESGGSARDALNMLEQVRFSSAQVTKLSVLQVLGHIDDERLINLLETILFSGPGSVLQALHDLNFETFAAEYVWRRLIELSRALLWVKYGVDDHQVRENHQTLQALAQKCSLKKIKKFLRLLYASEQTFLRTTSQHLFLEMLFIRLSSGNDDDNEGGAAPAAQAVAVEPDLEHDSDEELDEDEQEDDEEEIEEGSSTESNWKQFAKHVESELREPLLASVFKQGHATEFDSKSKTLTVEFAKDLSFFTDMLEANKSKWQPLLLESFDEQINLNFQFVREPLRDRVERKAEPMPNIAQSGASAPQTGPKRMYNSFQKRKPQALAPGLKESSVDTSDAALWPKAHLLLNHFPGRITEIREQ